MPDMQISGECRYQACSKHYQHSFIMSTAKSRYLSSIWQRKGPGTKSISVIAKVAWYKINFIGSQLCRKEVRSNSDYRICTSSILYGLVRNPALPPESPQQTGFDADHARTVRRLQVSGTGWIPPSPFVQFKLYQGEVFQYKPGASDPVRTNQWIDLCQGLVGIHPGRDP